LTPKKLADCIEAYSEAIDGPLIAQCMKDLSNLLRTLQIPKGKDLSNVLADRLAGAYQNRAKPTVGELNAALIPLHRVLTVLSTPKGRVPIHNFFILLEQNKEMSFSVFLSRASSPSGEPSPKVGSYIEDLQGAVANPEGFEHVVLRLAKDKEITPDDLSDIASGFTGLRKKWGRKAALEAMWAKHAAHMKAVNSFVAANGKSAA
jgi:hypothetical protein